MLQTALLLNIDYLGVSVPGWDPIMAWPSGTQARGALSLQTPVTFIFSTPAKQAEVQTVCPQWTKTLLAKADYISSSAPT